MGVLISALYRMRRPVLKFRNLSVPVMGSHISRTVWKHLWKGGYERPEIDAVLSLMRPQDKILELGTGMGIVSGVVAKSEPTATIETYEANPSLMEPIKELHATNGITNVTSHNAILLPTDREEKIEFNLHENFTQGSIRDVESRASVEVDVRDIRAVLHDFAPDLFVCDIEGAEEQVFDGISLLGLRGLVIELHPDIISRTAERRIFDLCREAGLYPRVDLSDLNVVAFERVE